MVKGLGDEQQSLTLMMRYKGSIVSRDEIVNRTKESAIILLGAAEKMIHKALGIQMGIYFAVPLFLAVVHGIVGIYVANRVITIFGEVNVLSSILFTAAMFIVIYGIYFVGTYLNSKNVIK